MAVFCTHRKTEAGFYGATVAMGVERTFAWLENARQLCQDYEELPQHHESFIHITMIRLMLRKLTGNQRSR